VIPSKFDLFDTYRVLLTLVCAVYATVVTARTLWGWVVYFSAPGRTTTILRSYAIAQILGIRMRTFGWEVAQILMWTGVFCGLVYLHGRIGS
jgi:hypothetical protein